MRLRPDEISEVLRRQIASLQQDLSILETGVVLEVGDSIARVYGLSKVMAGELLEFPNQVIGLALNLEEDNVGAVLFGSDTLIKEGDTVRRTGRIIEAPVGECMLGRTVNALGQAIDAKGQIKAEKFRPIERLAPSIVERRPVHQPLQTGLKAIDALTPIGRGQRELVIGDRQTGKTALVVDVIINQKDTDVICIYVAIGQKQASVVRVVQELQRRGAMDYTIVVSASASEAPALRYIAPYTGCAMGEEFMEKSRHVLVVYDDLSKHAVAYRELSLLLRRPPGREAYPGDIFYLHARLLERAAKLNDERGGGSLTAIPIVETQAGNISGYIPTNVISITDGQIYLESSLFYQGVRPAINAGLSVSRVGGAAQVPAMKKVGAPLRMNLAQYRELAAFAQFASELDVTTQRQLARGERAVEILKQDQYEPMPVEDQILSIFAVTTGLLDHLDVQNIRPFEKALLAHFHNEKADLLAKLRETRELTDELAQELSDAIRELAEAFAPAPAEEGQPEAVH